MGHWYYGIHSPGWADYWTAGSPGMDLKVPNFLPSAAYVEPKTLNLLKIQYLTKYL